MKRLTRKIITIVAVVSFLLGLAFFTYPYVTRFISETTSDAVILKYENRIKDGDSKTEGQLRKLYDDMYEYNEAIYENKQSGLVDQTSYQQTLFNFSDYGLTSDIFGYIDIPKLNEKLPLYLGASKDNMALGAALLAYTSIPLSQDNTNAVIAAHRGYRGADFFRHIDKLEHGDEIMVTNPWGVLTYCVIETKVVEKDDIAEVYIQQGKTLLTLSSCHPYTKNTHRYLVYAELIDSIQKNK